MKLIFKEYYIKDSKFIFSVIFGLIAISVMEYLVCSNLPIVIKDSFFDYYNKESILQFYKYLIFAGPLTILISTYVIFRIVKSKNHIILSGLISFLTTVVLSSINFIFIKSFDTWFFLKNLISIFVLIITWTIFTQTQKDKAKALSTGYFAFLLTIEVIELFQGIILKGKLEIINFVFAVLFAGILSIIFEFLTKMSLNVLRFQSKEY